MKNHERTQEFIDWAFACRVETTEEKITLIVFAMFANIEGSGVITLLDMSKFASSPTWDIPFAVRGLRLANFIIADISNDGEISFRLLIGEPK